MDRRGPRLVQRTARARANVTDLMTNLAKIGGLIERARQPGTITLDELA